MPRYCFTVEAEPDWAPLEQLCRLCRASPKLPPLDPGEFMYMGRVGAARRPPIHLYKHVYSRRYLNLDDAGHAFRIQWRLRPGAGDIAVATCQPHRDLLSALGVLDLGAVCKRSRRRPDDAARQQH
jgi:hypothetical protein